MFCLSKKTELALQGFSAFEGEPAAPSEYSQSLRTSATAGKQKKEEKKTIVTLFVYASCFSLWRFDSMFERSAQQWAEGKEYRFFNF